MSNTMTESQIQKTMEEILKKISLRHIKKLTIYYPDCKSVRENVILLRRSTRLIFREYKLNRNEEIFNVSLDEIDELELCEISEKVYEIRFLNVDYWKLQIEL